MAAMKTLWQSGLDKLHEVLAALEAESHHLATEVKTALNDLKADAPVLEAEAAQDAEHVAVTAETQGIKPAEAEAVADAGKLAAEAGADVADAVKDATTTPAPAASDTPAA